MSIERFDLTEGWMTGWKTDWIKVGLLAGLQFKWLKVWDMREGERFGVRLRQSLSLLERLGTRFGISFD